MKQFIALFDHIDQTQSTNEKIAHIKNYFSTCSDEDGAWALFFLCGHRIKRLISSRMLLEWSLDVIALPSWLIEESYAAVGDTAETLALLLPRKEEGTNKTEYSLSEWMENVIKPLQQASEQVKKEKILFFWQQLSTKEIFIINKILTGAFRMGVSSLITLKALSQATDIPREILTQRLMGHWEPTGALFKTLRSKESQKRYLTPYPFYLAYPFEGQLEDLGDLSAWQIEWKWDGIRSQAVIGHEGVALWSRGNEMISHQFPELLEAFKDLPTGTVLDGEILGFSEGKPLSFAELQKRLGRKNVSKAMLSQVPIAFIAYDLLELEHVDVRDKPMQQRRLMLEHLKLSSSRIMLSPLIEATSWPEILQLRLESRERGAEGLMLKKKDSPYGVGRQKGYWWKYKVDPMTIDAVLIYAQAGSGRRSNLFTDYTFGIWKEDALIPIAKAYSGLDQEEIHELDRWIRKNTEEKFGPVRKVKAHQVFEIAFEGIQVSKRHKSEVALRFPRIARWRKDKPIEECDTLDSIKQQFLPE